MIVFVHGVPETDRIWDALRAELDQPSVAVSLPGFGRPRPGGFTATKDEYVEWLAGELRELDGAIDEPIDLVGHDWGAGLTLRLAIHPDRPVALRSWAIDVANIFHPGYEWHDFARIWQTPGDGEAFFEQQLATPVDERAGVFEMFGLATDDARTMASWLDAEMADSILTLYRSATPNPHAHWGDDLAPTDAPGLVLVPTADPFGDDDRAAEVAATLGARTATLDGLGHWWPLEDPRSSAAALRSFWSSLATA